MTHRALILGTLAGQVDAMEHLRQEGWVVHACGHRAEGPGVEAADEFFQVDILDVDAVAALALRLGSDVVYSVGSDIAMPTIARVSERLGLPHFHDVETTEILHRKDLMRAFLDRTGVSRVAHRRVSTVADLDGFDTWPAIVKPTDSQGQRGITMVEDGRAAAAALPDALAASRTDTAIIEELLDGPEISVHVFVVDGRVRFMLPSDRHVWSGPLVGIPRAHTVPSSFLDPADESEVRRLVHDLVAALGVRTGPLYVQLRLTERRGPRIIEVASRLDGCHLWRLVELHTGVDLLATCFDLLGGGTWSDPAPWSNDRVHELRFWLGPPDVPFRRSDHPLPDDVRVLHHEYQVEEGDEPRDINGVVSRLGYYIIEEDV